MTTDFTDIDLLHFEAEGPPSLPATTERGHVGNDGAQIWYTAWPGAGTPVILLHGGMGNAGNFGFQVPALIAAGHRVIAIDSRGHGRSTRDAKPYSYDLLASDVLAVMDHLRLAKGAIIGWSDGACTGLVLARHHPDRLAGVFYFACNMDDTGTKPFVYTEMIGRCLARHKADYAALSSTPADFDAFMEAVGLMQRSQPNYTAADLAAIRVPVTIAQAAHDEFIKPEHAAYLARTIPGAKLVELPGVGHFAPVQKPAQFNAAVLAFLAELNEA